MLAGVRRLLLLVSAVVFVDAMLFTALTPLVPGYADEFDLSKYEGVGMDSVQRRGDEVVERALAWLSAEPARPFFASMAPIALRVRSRLPP